MASSQRAIVLDAASRSFIGFSLVPEFETLTLGSLVSALAILNAASLLESSVRSTSI